MRKAFDSTEDFSNEHSTEVFDCINSVDTMITEYSNDTVYSGINPIIADSASDGKIKITTYVEKNERIGVRFKSSEFLYFDRGEKIYIHFSDGTIEKIGNESDIMNENASFDLYMQKDSTIIRELLTKKVQLIQLMHDKKVTKAYLNKSSSENFSKMLNCLFN